MRPESDLLVALGIVEAEMSREIWTTVGTVAAAAVVLAVLWYVLYRNREPILRALSFLAKPRNFLATSFVMAAIVYGSTKSDVVVPQTKTADFRQTTATSSNPTSGLVEYWQSSETTNGVKVSLFGGTVTNELNFIAGQFVYAFDSSTSVSTPQGLPDNKLWCRPATSSNWVATTTHSYFNTNGHFSAAIASLPGNLSPSYYNLWFVGPEANLPPIVVEVTGGIDIVNVTITSSRVSVTFTGTDARFTTGSHVYHFQSRTNRDGVFTEWENISSLTLSGGQVTGTIVVDGFTVDRYREYRVYSDLEVAQ